MAIPLIAGKKGADVAQGAGKALLGDIYTRRWTSQVGKGKHKKLVDHELKVNPVSIGLGLVAAGAAATAGLMALWLAQMRVAPKTGVTVGYSARLTYIGGVITASSPIVVYRGKLPIAYTTWAANGGEGPRPDDYLPSEPGWYTTDSYVRADDKGIDYVWNAKNDDKKSYAIEKREGFKIDVGL